MEYLRKYRGTYMQKVYSEQIKVFQTLVFIQIFVLEYLNTSLYYSRLYNITES